MDAVLTEVTNAAAEAAKIASLVRPHFDTPAVGIDRRLTEVHGHVIHRIMVRRNQSEANITDENENVSVVCSHCFGWPDRPLPRTSNLGTPGPEASEVQADKK